MRASKYVTDTISEKYLHNEFISNKGADKQLNVDVQSIWQHDWHKFLQYSLLSFRLKCVLHTAFEHFVENLLSNIWQNKVHLSALYFCVLSVHAVKELFPLVKLLLLKVTGPNVFLSIPFLNTYQKFKWDLNKHLAMIITCRLTLVSNINV